MFMPPGYDVDQLSAPFDVVLPIFSEEGELRRDPYVIALRKDCYEEAVIQMPGMKAIVYTPHIIPLSESVGSLHVKSSPSGASVALDGTYRGKTPLSLMEICSGKHELELKHASGDYTGEIVIEKGEILPVNIKLEGKQ